jgi:hypothetical protein
MNSHIEPIHSIKTKVGIAIGLRVGHQGAASTTIFSSSCSLTPHPLLHSYFVSYGYRRRCLQMKSSAQAGVLLSLATASLAAYDLVKTYSGNSFFDSWSYYGHYDNLTSGVQFPRLSIRTAPQMYSPVLTLRSNRGCDLR